MFAVLLIMEKLWLLKPLSKCRPLAHLYVVFFVVISFVIFNAENMGQAPLRHWRSVRCRRYPAGFCRGGLLSAQLRSGADSGRFGSHPPPPGMGLSASPQYPTAGKVLNALEPFTLFVLLLVMTGYLVDGSFNPFLYFRF